MDEFEKNTTKLKEDDLPEEIYKRSNFPFIKAFILGIILLVLGVIANYPIQRTITSSIKAGLSHLRSCPISFDKIEYSTFLPKMLFKNIIIQGRCFNSYKSNLNIKKLLLKFGPSFYPPGIKLTVPFKRGKTKLIASFAASPFGHVLKIPNGTIDPNSFAEIWNGVPPIGGTFKINLIADLSNKTVESAKLLLKSKNVVINGQDIQGFQVPKLAIGNLALKARFNGKKLRIISLIVGNTSSPIIAEFKGDITINQMNINYSKIDLEGKIKFSKKFLDDFAILTLFLGSKKSDNGFYKLKIGGTFAMPIPKVL